VTRSIGRQHVACFAQANSHGHCGDAKTRYCRSKPMPTMMGAWPARQPKLTANATFFSAPNASPSASVTSGRSPPVCVPATFSPGTKTRTASGVASPSASASQPSIVTSRSLALVIESMCPFNWVEACSPAATAASIRSERFEMLRPASCRAAESGSVVAGGVAVPVSQTVPRKLPRNNTSDAPTKTLLGIEFSSNGTPAMIASQRHLSKI
jgi:hypothetical protein